MPSRVIQGEIRLAIERSDIQIAWAAGLFEGEGSFFTRRVAGHAYSVACLTTTDLDVLERFRDVVGCGRIQRPTAGKKPQHKTQYRWQAAASADVQRLGHLFGPYLGERRSARLAEVLAARAASEKALEVWDDECLNCGRVYQTGRKSQLYCTVRCADRAAKLRSRINA